MKNSLIPKKHVVPGKNYWCISNNHSVLNLMEYTGNDIYKDFKLSFNSQNIRVMFEGYTNINKSRIPNKYLTPNRHYWCRYLNENELSLKRYENDNSFYSIPHDVFWPAENVKVIFEDYEN